MLRKASNSKYLRAQSSLFDAKSPEYIVYGRQAENPEAKAPTSWVRDGNSVTGLMVESAEILAVKTLQT